MIAGRNNLPILQYSHPTIAGQHQGLINEISSSLDIAGLGENYRSILEKPPT